MVREIIEEEIACRGYTEPAWIIAELTKTSKHNVERLLTFENRLTRVECMILEKAFGLSDGFFARFQASCEKRYPEQP